MRAVVDVIRMQQGFVCRVLCLPMIASLCALCLSRLRLSIKVLTNSVCLRRYLICARYLLALSPVWVPLRRFCSASVRG